MAINPLFRIAVIVDLLLTLSEQAGIPLPWIRHLCGGGIVRFGFFVGVAYCLSEVIQMLERFRNER